MSIEKKEFIWKNNQMMPSEQAQTHVLSHALHYGSGVFEGIRFYKTNEGSAIYKLHEHIERLFYSAKTIGMTIPYTIDEIKRAVIDTVEKNKIICGYIRPIAYYGVGSMKVVPDKNLTVDVVIACWPWGSYLEASAIDIKISDFIRIHPKSTVADAKICGHYVNSIMAGLAIKGTKYHEALLLDTDGFVAEGSAENIFLVKNGKIITTKAGTILQGITRDTVMKIAKEFGYEVIEKLFKPNEVFSADEVFVTGTAVEITPVRSLDDKLIANGEIGHITTRIKDYYQDIIHGKVPKHYDSLTPIKIAKEVEYV